MFCLPFNLIQVQGYSTAGAAIVLAILILYLLSRYVGVRGEPRRRVRTGPQGSLPSASPSRDALSPVILLSEATEDERSMYVAGIRHRQLLGGRS
jgi:hypothetical protein